ncbi:MAG: NADH-quinone oxidoreductase subunit NuoE [Clostridiales bacterium]|nr:NADH-quinone oxidoreductase subunit NuoE [Clostridiales bacterium]
MSEKQKFEKLNAFIKVQKDLDGPLMPVMQFAQDVFGYLPMDVQQAIAEGLGIPMTKVYGVATFYSQFVLEEQGQHIVSLCMGTACYVKGAQKILDVLEEELGIKDGKTTEDRKFTLSGTRCLGCCGLAPVMMIGEDVYGQLEPEQIPEILAKYKTQEVAS